jgi:hypothetical protein
MQRSLYYFVPCKNSERELRPMRSDEHDCCVKG